MNRPPQEEDCRWGQGRRGGRGRGQEACSYVGMGGGSMGCMTSLFNMSGKLGDELMCMAPRRLRRGRAGRGADCRDPGCRWHMHIKHCGGAWVKVKEPEGFGKKKGGKKGGQWLQCVAGRWREVCLCLTGAAALQSLLRAELSRTGHPQWCCSCLPACRCHCRRRRQQQQRRWWGCGWGQAPRRRACTRQAPQERRAAAGGRGPANHRLLPSHRGRRSPGGGGRRV